MTLRISYSTLSSIAAQASLYWIQLGDGGYIVWFGTDRYFAECEVRGDDIAAFEADLKASGTEVPSIDDAVVLSDRARGNRIVGPRTSTGLPKLVMEPREGSEVIYATHDFCDPTTWYTESVRVTDEVATDDGMGTTWSVTHERLIDLRHGRVLDCEALIAEQQELNPGDPHGYQVVVKVDGVEAQMRSPYGNDGNYEVDYHAGKVIFFESQAGKTVIVSYSHANESGWVLAPLPGKVLDVEASKVQFSEDVVLTGSIKFVVEGFVEVFAPELWDGYDPPGPYPAGTRIPLVTQIYARIDQFIDEAVGTQVVIPPVGGAVRGNTKARYCFTFRYGTIRRLSSAIGMRLVCRLVSDEPLLGERATATLYCTSRDE